MQQPPKTFCRTRFWYEFYVHFGCKTPANECRAKIRVFAVSTRNDVNTTNATMLALWQSGIIEPVSIITFALPSWPAGSLCFILLKSRPVGRVLEKEFIDHEGFCRPLGVPTIQCPRHSNPHFLSWEKRHKVTRLFGHPTKRSVAGGTRANLCSLVSTRNHWK